MANVAVFNMGGKEVGTLDLSDAVFGVEVNEHLVHMAVVWQLANKQRLAHFQMRIQQYRSTNIFDFVLENIAFFLLRRQHICYGCLLYTSRCV